MTSPASPVTFAAPVKPAAPVAKFDLDGLTFNVVFDLNQLSTIEDRTGRTTIDLLNEFVSYFGPEGGTDEQNAEAAKRFSVTTVSRFVSVCCDLKPQRIGLAELRPAFFALLTPFAAAVRQLNGVADELASPEADSNPSAAPGEVFVA
jgi:hypothetical protein